VKVPGQEEEKLHPDEADVKQTPEGQVLEVQAGRRAVLFRRGHSEEDFDNLCDAVQQAVDGERAGLYISSTYRACSIASIPFRILGGLVKVCTRRTLTQPKRPTWNYELEVLINTMRTSAWNGPRDVAALRVVTDIHIPHFMLDDSCLRCAAQAPRPGGSAEQPVSVEWVWPSEGAPDAPKSLLEPHVRNGATGSPQWREQLRESPVILYLHGGAYCLCNPGTHRGLLWPIVNQSKAFACVVDYRRPPDFPVSAAVEDALAVYLYILSLGVDPCRIVFMGDSAGGALCVSLLVALRDGTYPTGRAALPAAAVLLSPWVDVACDRGSLTSEAKYDFIPPDLAEVLIKATCGGKSPSDPVISPINSDLSNLPPMLVHVGQCEGLRDQCVAFAEKAKAAGNDCTLREWTDMVHIFHLFHFAHATPKTALQHAAAYARRKAGFLVAKRLTLDIVHCMDLVHPMRLPVRSVKVTVTGGTSAPQSTWSAQGPEPDFHSSGVFHVLYFDDPHKVDTLEVVVSETSLGFATTLGTATIKWCGSPCVDSVQLTGGGELGYRIGCTDDVSVPGYMLSRAA